MISEFLTVTSAPVKIQTPEDDWLTVREAAELLKLKYTSLYRWIRLGEGPVFHRIGGRVFYRRSAIEAFVAAGEMKPAPHQASA
jgi:excisionase family DNA binding protein